MLEKSTVFILGAGASFGYGYPLGRKLVDDILGGLNHPDKPLHKKLQFLDYSESDIKTFRRDLFTSDVDSIDFFLERRSEYLEIGKAAIMLILTFCEDKDLLRTEGPERWYGDIINPLKKYPFQPINNIGFITFNYDRSLDHYIFMSFKHTYGFTDFECRNAVQTIPIIHLHGQLGKLPWQTTEDTGRPYGTNNAHFEILHAYDGRDIDSLKRHRTADYFLNISQQIKIIHEADVDNDPEFTQAHDLLANAHKIYFLGFGYLEENLKRLKIADLTQTLPAPNGQYSRAITGTSIGLGAARISRITEITNGRLKLSRENNTIKDFIREQIALE